MSKTPAPMMSYILLGRDNEEKKREKKKKRFKIRNLLEGDKHKREKEKT